jgi:phosphatidylinositol glycan class X
MSATSHFDPSFGFHPVYKTCVSLPDDRANCALQIAYSLPPDVLVDPYELENYRPSYTFDFVGVTDLEAPVFWADSRDSELLTTVRLPADMADEVCVDLPIHLRYGRPSNSSTHGSITVPCPAVYWSCRMFRISAFSRGY